MTRRTKPRARAWHECSKDAREEVLTRFADVNFPNWFGDGVEAMRAAKLALGLLERAARPRKPRKRRKKGTRK